MIRLKEKVNKTQVIKELREELSKQLEGTHDPEYSLTLCMIGAEMIFDKLRLPQVITSDKNPTWCKSQWTCTNRLCSQPNGMCSSDHRVFIR